MPSSAPGPGSRSKQGRVIKGHKIGLTSKAMQNAVGIAEPDYGVLFEDMFYARCRRNPLRPLSCAAHRGRTRVHPEDGAEGAELHASSMCSTPPTTSRRRWRFSKPGCIASIRRPKSARKVMDTISDNAANAALVLGGRPFRPHDVDLRWIGALLFRNGQIEETGVAAGVLNHPANGVAWLANRLAPHGEHLAAGEVVLAGSFTRPVDIRKGDTFHADYGPFGSISCSSFRGRHKWRDARASISAASSTPTRFPTPAASATS